MALQIKKMPTKRVNGLAPNMSGTSTLKKSRTEDPERLVSRLRLVAMQREVGANAPALDDYQSLTDMIAQASGTPEHLPTSEQIRRVKDALRAASDGPRLVKVSIDKGGDAIRRLEHPLLDAAAFRTYI